MAKALTRGERSVPDLSPSALRAGMRTLTLVSAVLSLGLEPRACCLRDSYADQLRHDGSVGLGGFEPPLHGV